MVAYAKLAGISTDVFIDHKQTIYFSHSISGCLNSSLNEFPVEDLRLMIGQDLSLEYLMPLAVDHLKNTHLLLVTTTLVTYSRMSLS